MRIGLISDTHGRLRPEVFPHFEGVELILHAGDIGDSSILAELSVIAPVRAVLGNTDGFDLGASVPELQTMELEGHVVVVTHGHQLGSPTPRLLRAAHPDADVIVFGHTHRSLIERQDGVLIVNPGAAGPQRFNLKPTIGLLELTERGAATATIQEL